MEKYYSATVTPAPAKRIYMGSNPTLTFVCAKLSQLNFVPSGPYAQS